MLIFRLIGLLLGLGICASLCAYIFTRQRKYLTLAGRLFRFAVYAALIFFALLVGERLFVPFI
jgi:hypothetical protein